MSGRRPKTVVVTGASAGVGRATAREFGRRGDRVALLARGEERLNHAVSEIEALGGQAIALPLDVSDPEAIDAAASAVEAQFGPIDVWVNDAMATIFAPLHEIQPDEIRRATEVTYLGFAYGTMAALKRMRPRDHGTIVQVGSALAYRAIPLQSAYCAAKYAIRGLTDSLRVELMHDKSNVRITMVQLPAMNTPQFGWVRNRLKNMPQPVPPIYEPEVAARTIVHASDHPRREYWVGRMTVASIIGNRIAPALLDRYLAAKGYTDQQTDQPTPPDHRDYLFSPVPGDPQAHGDFTERSTDISIQNKLNLHRKSAAFAGAALVAAGAGGIAALSHR